MCRMPSGAEGHFQLVVNSPPVPLRLMIYYRRTMREPKYCPLRAQSLGLSPLYHWSAYPGVSLNDRLSSSQRTPNYNLTIRHRAGIA